MLQKSKDEKRFYLEKGIKFLLFFIVFCNFVANNETESTLDDS